MNYITNFFCIISLSSCCSFFQNSQHEDSNGVSHYDSKILVNGRLVDALDFATPSPSFVYDDSEYGLIYIQSKLRCLAKTNLQGVQLVTNLSLRARKMLAELTMGDIKGYYKTLTDDAYGAQTENSYIGVLSFQDLMELSKSQGYFSMGSQEDDIILLDIEDQNKQKLFLDVSIAFSMPNVIFLEIQLKNELWKCAVINSRIWKKIYDTLCNV